MEERKDTDEREEEKGRCWNKETEWDVNKGTRGMAWGRSEERSYTGCAGRNHRRQLRRVIKRRMLLVFPSKGDGDAGRKGRRRDRESKAQRVSNPHPQNVMTCILSRRAQTKPSKSGSISCGLSQGKAWWLLQFRPFTLLFLWRRNFHYLFAQTFIALRDGTF